jgi:signal transduction histidine kinase
MKQRIRGAIVGVSAIVMLALGVPLAILVHRSVVDSEVVELQATAATALAEIDVPLNDANLRAFASEPEAPDHFGVYDPVGRRVFGSGPRTADATVRRALRGNAASSTADALVVATPIVETGSETVRGALRVAESLDGAEQRARAAYLLMAAAGFAALGLAWVIGNRLARTLSDPLSDLAARAEGIGDKESLEPGEPSGLAEIDALDAVLRRRARDVNQAILRERQFSEDVSHQLRTPVTALRLKLEAAQATAATAPETFANALRDLDRIEATIHHLLAVARDSTPRPDPLRLDAVVAAAVDRWQQQARAEGRVVEIVRAEPATVMAHRASIDEVLDVLVDNALRHGEGNVSITVRRVANGVAIDVADEGRSVSALHAERVFDRGHGSGTGIGLSVARAVAEADGGRLLLSGQSPTTFSLLLLAQ